MPRIPTHAECLQLLKKYKLPENVVAHLVTVNKLAMFLARKMNERGEKVNLELVDAGSLLHDIDKMRSLKEGNHGVLSRRILEGEGYPEVGQIAEKHVIHNILETGDLSSLEEKIVFYADKRVTHDKIVSVEERFRYFRERYVQYLDAINKAEPLMKKLETELLEKAGISEDSIGKV